MIVIKKKCLSASVMLSTKVSLLVLLSIASGCATPSRELLQNAFNNAEPFYADNALKFDLKTTADLNAYHQQAESCTVFIIQAQERGVLDKLILDASLLQDLINGEQKVQGVLQLNKVTLMPQQDVQFSVSRAERAKFVAIIPGYYPAPNPNYSFVVELPLKLHKHGWLFPEYIAAYEPLSVTMKLGRLNVIQETFIPRGDQILLSDKASGGDTTNGAAAYGSSMYEKVDKAAFEQLTNGVSDGVSTLSKKIPSGSTGKQ